MKIGIPDLISNSYFPVVAAVELGCFRDEGVDAEIELIFPVDRCYRALRDGDIAFVGGSAHSALSAFPEWEGARLLCAQAQGMYWFLVMRAALNVRRGDLSAVKGRRIGAAPWVEMGLRRLLIEGGIDIEADAVTIAPVPGAVARPGELVNFGVTAAKALADGLIDGFWANGMAAEVAVASGTGTVVADIRRDGPHAAFNFTMASIAATEASITDRPDIAAAAVRAVVRAQAALRADPSLATDVGRALFPEHEADLIATLIARDAPYYDAAITPEFVADMNRFSRDVGILDGDPAYDRIVATQFAPLWRP